MGVVLPKPLVPRVVDDRLWVSVIVGNTEGMKSSCATFECAGNENGMLLVLERMTLMSPL